MVDKRTWDEFRSSGMLWWINMMLHTFGWAIVCDMDGDIIKSAYPARVKFRGFTEDRNDEGYRKVSEYMKINATELRDEWKD